MLIFALDTSLERTSLCLFDSQGKQELMSRSLPFNQENSAEKSLVLLQEMFLQDETCEMWQALERIAVVTGPGSFTGIRMGLSVAKALGLSFHIPVVGIDTLSALVAPYILAELIENTPNTRSQKAPIAAAIDARHGHVYFALAPHPPFAQSPPPATEKSLASANTCNRNWDWDWIEPPQHMAISDAVAVLRALPSPARLCGPAGGLLYQKLAEEGSEAVWLKETTAPDITWVARLGARRSLERFPPVPFYLRPAGIGPGR